MQQALPALKVQSGPRVRKALLVTSAQRDLRVRRVPWVQLAQRVPKGPSGPKVLWGRKGLLDHRARPVLPEAML